MESATFRKWLAERGCRFDQHEHEKRGEGQVIVTVHREGRKAEVPLGGSHQILDARVVRQACEELGLELSSAARRSRSLPIANSRYWSIAELWQSNGVRPPRGVEAGDNGYRPQVGKRVSIGQSLEQMELFYIHGEVSFSKSLALTALWLS